MPEQRQLLRLISHSFGRLHGPIYFWRKNAPPNHLSRRSCRCAASWCRTVRSFSGLMGALQQVSRVASFSESASLQCARRR